MIKVCSAVVVAFVEIQLVLTNRKITSRIDVFFCWAFSDIVDLLAAGQEDLYSVVLKWVVRGGNNDAGVEIERFCQIRDSRRGDDACRFTMCVFYRRTGMKRRFDPFA